MVFRSPKQPSAVCRISVTHGFGLSRWAFACWSTVSSEIAVLKRPFWLELVDIARNGRSGLNSSTVSRGIAVRGLDASTVWNGIAVRGLELVAVSRGIVVYALPAASTCRQSRAEVAAVSPSAAWNCRQSRAESPFMRCQRPRIVDSLKRTCRSRLGIGDSPTRNRRLCVASGLELSTVSSGIAVRGSEFATVSSGIAVSQPQGCIDSWGSHWLRRRVKGSIHEG